MKRIYSMVHDNPGEPLFSTSFNTPKKLKEYGITSQVHKHIHASVEYKSLNKNIFAEGTEEALWLKKTQDTWRQCFEEANKEDIDIVSHMDLFVLPKKLVEIYKEEICYPGTLTLDYTKDKLYDIHRLMFDELFDMYPTIEGLFIRLGETYLYDFPYHIGNGPSAIKEEYGGNVITKDAYLKVINFLREEVCVKHNKKIFMRTWDCLNDGFHANKEYYLEITNQIEPHENLFFSIKHTALDFWRSVKVNECLGQGKHQQIIEVQAQREYEGKGAYPCYVMDGVINYFPENKVEMGLKDFVDDPLFKGIFVWPRGGGWYGPYIDEKREFWADINTYVICQYVNKPYLSEEEIFNTYLEEKMQIVDKEQQKLFRELCKVSSEAILKGRYCKEYDETLNEIVLPVNLWMRDDRLGGSDRLKPIFDVVYEKGKMKEILDEKHESVLLWNKVKEISQQIHIEDAFLNEFIRVSSDYGYRLFRLIEAGWQVLVLGYIGDVTKIYDKEQMKYWINEFDNRLEIYNELRKVEICPSLYKLIYFALPDLPEPKEGLGESVDKYRKSLT